jgi:4-diphosphocytidyl-2-C-methyl-D-erythritol kinase
MFGYENMKYTIEAPCKINLHLKIGDKRPDGFHDLKSIFACLAFADTLRFECAGKDGDCSIEMTGGHIPLEKNLVFRAVSLFRERIGFTKGLCIHLDKRIPLGAGLGGGSSNAASSLLALNYLAGTALSKEKLLEMAAMLGSDVPFFLTGGTAWVSGRGECIEAVEPPQGLWVVLAKPSFSSDTASAYKLLDQARTLKERDKKPKELLTKEAMLRTLGQDPENWPFFNDFQSVFLDPQLYYGVEDSIKGTYKTILEEFNKLGASIAGLSGSGSCGFGIFKDRQKAEIAEKALGNYKNHQFFTLLTFFLASTPFRY